MPGVIDAIKGIFGKSPIDSIKDIISEFHMSPEEKQKFLEAAEERLLARDKMIMDNATAVLQIEMQNTADARAMNSKIQGDRPSWLAKNIAYMIDLFVAIIWGSFTFYLAARAFKLIDTDQHVDLTAILGIYAAVSTQFGIVINFHRGSSQGSADKQKTLDRMTK